MTFTVKTLERCLRQQIKVKTLIDYLDDVVRHASQQESIDDFNRKLNELVDSCIPKMQVVAFAGSWLPQCSVTSKLRCQVSWIEFVSKFVPGFSSSRIVDCESNPKFQPLNFKELAYLTLWKELYETYGQPTVKHLFEKCAFLFEVEESLHLLVAYPGGAISQRMLKYEGLSKTLIGLPSNGAQRSKSGNPYQLAMPSPQPILEAAASAEQQQTDNSEGQKEKDSISGTESDKMQTSQDDNINKIIGEGEIERPREPRWLKPKPEELQKIIDLRNKMLSSSQPSAAMSSLTPSLLHVLNFVLVKPDPEIKSTNKRLILKQKVIISTDRPKPKLPRDWTGLVLPDNLAQLANERKQVQIHVYIISEMLARELGVRVKPKGRAKRNRRGKAQNPSDPPVATEKDQEVIPEEQPGTVPGNDVELRKLIDPVEEQTFSSFSPKVTLPIGSFLYNKTTSTKWPESHSLRRAATLAPADTVSALKRVVNDILGVAISSESAYEYCNNVIKKNWTNLQDESFALNTIIWKIIKRHGKFGNTQMHRLLKSCLQYWRGKHLEKQSRMQAKRKTKQTNNLIVSDEGHGQGQTNAKCDLNPSVIDLTQTTSSTGSTHFSGPFPNQTPTPTPELIDLAMEMEVDENPSGLNSLQQLSGKCATASNSLSGPNNPSKRKQKQVIVRKDSGQSSQPKKFKCLKDAVPYNCVMQALKQIFHMMKLDELLGSKRNVRGFFKFVRKALVLGGAKSSLHLSQLMALIRPEETPLGQACGYDRCATETLTAKVVTWLFNNYVLVLLHTSFYITECSFTRFHVNFYLRESWTGAAYKMQQSLIKKGALKLDTSSSLSQPSVNAVLRYVPKSNLSLRSLLVMKRPVTSSAFTQSGAGPDIKTLKLFLHYVDANVNQSRPRLPTVLQVEWRNFISRYKANGWPKLYFLRMDIQDAYPGVSLPKLVDILVNTNNEAGYGLVQKQYLVFNAAGRKVVRGSFFNDRNRKNWHSGIHIRPAILMDLDRDRPIQVVPILNEMTKLLTISRVIKIGKRLYEFNYGLPQGWNLSPILCSIYYGYIDATLYIPFVSTPGRLFLRLVDDYLFISPEANDILNLMQLMKIGCEKYGIKLNQEKSETNIFVRSDVPNLESDSHCEKITFCGWNFCLSCGHVSRDYSKYHGQDFSSTISFQMPNNVYSPEQFIRLRATLIMPARLKPILMDPGINCFKRILLTTFEASIILGFRFYAICRVVYPSLNAVKEDGRAEVLFSSIRLCCCRLANFILRHSKQGLGGSNSELCCNENCCGMVSTSTDAVDLSANLVSYHSLLWVALKGFRLKLMVHSTPFRKHLIPKIDAYIKTLGKKMGPVQCQTVFTLLGKEMPTELKKIRI